MNNFHSLLGWRLTAWRNQDKIRIPAANLYSNSHRVESVVIPVVGQDYVEEGRLAGIFASRFFPELKEVVLVSDCPANVFKELPEKVRVVTLDPTAVTPREHPYQSIFRSRIIKLCAPLQAAHENILMIDSDLMILKPIRIPFVDHVVAGCFRTGRMISKYYDSEIQAMPSELSGVYRPYLKQHLNGAFLAAKKTTWQRLSPAWLGIYISLWSKLPSTQAPTDQLPLCCALDHLELTTSDLGDWVNWPVSKKIGGQLTPIPPDVIGAHGGFPLAEWYRYLENPEQPLLFLDSTQTRRIRYLTDSEKQQS